MRELVVTVPEEMNEHGGTMLWYGSWLVSEDGIEGDGFYSGRGGVSRRYTVPASAVGLRVRRWPNEGLEAEYVDVMGLAQVQDLSAADLDFDVTQPFSRLSFPGPAPVEMSVKGSDR
jgi:hypothetical protein